MSELRLERDGPLAIVTLMRAAKLNALTRAMLDGWTAVADEIERDDACRVVHPHRRRAKGLLRRCRHRRLGRARPAGRSAGAGSARGTASSTAGRGCASR